MRVPNHKKNNLRTKTFIISFLLSLKGPGTPSIASGASFPSFCPQDRPKRPRGRANLEIPKTTPDTTPAQKTSNFHAPQNIHFEIRCLFVGFEALSLKRAPKLTFRSNTSKTKEKHRTTKRCRLTIRTPGEFVLGEKQKTIHQKLRF